MTTKSSYIRQLLFNDNLAKKYPDRFMTLISSSIINNCKHKQKNNKEKRINKFLEIKEKYDKCFILNYKPVLKYTLFDYFKTKNIKPNDKLKIFKHLFQSIKIMHRYGFIHRDLHLKNIMCDKDMLKWYIIDYGAIYNDSFDKNKNDNKWNLPKNNYEFENMTLIWLFLDNPIWDFIQKENIVISKFKNIIKYIKNDERFENIQKYIPKNKSNIINDCIILICATLYYDLYMESLNSNNNDIINSSFFKKYYNLEQSNAQYFLNIIKNI